MKENLMQKLFTLFFCVLLSSNAFALYNSAGLPDSAEIRRTIIDSWLTAPLDELKDKKNLVKENEIGISFEVRLEEYEDHFDIVVAPEKTITLEVISNGKKSVSETKSYPVTAPGSWVLHRSNVTGEPLYIDWYFVQDSEICAQFRAENKKTFADMKVYSFYAARSVPMGIPFERLYSASFENVYKWTSKTLPWKKVMPVLGQYELSKITSEIIRAQLPKMNYLEDACYNEHEELYSISTAKKYEVKDEQKIDYDKINLCGAGFVKYIIDGLVVPYSENGEGTRIIDMAKPTVVLESLSKSGVASQIWDLSFTLDWCRNLAVSSLAARSIKTAAPGYSSVDVTVENFSSEYVDGKMQNTAGYIPDNGYSIAALKSLMYVLGVTEPSYMYLAAIRQPVKSLDGIYAYNECALLIPYFDDKGRFVCVVFEKNKETSFDDFIKEYGDSYIHLERVKTSEYFYPMKYEESTSH